MTSLEKPIIAAVHGFAAGAGFNLASSCDLIIASEESKFVMSFSQIGLISDGGGLYFLPQIIGPYQSKELFFSAKPITAKKAYEYGIVNELVQTELLTETVTAKASLLSQGPVRAYGLMKKIINTAGTLEEVLETERITQTHLIMTEDHQEGVMAFKEKRIPKFNGK